MLDSRQCQPRERRIVERLIDIIGAERLHNPVVVDVQNVYEWWYTVQLKNLPQAMFSHMTDFDAVAPPWPRMFIEWDVDVTLPDEVWTTNVGIAFVSSPLEGDTYKHGWKWNAIAITFSDGHINAGFSYEGKIAEDGSLTRLELFEDKKKTEGFNEVYDVFTGENVPRSDQSIEALAMSHIKIAFIALTFLNCHNVKTIEHVPKVTRQMRRHGGAPVVYKTLDIPGFRTEYDSHPSAGGDSSGRKFHLCRGYFAEHHNFFGKYGYRKVWVPTHTRGKVEEGVVLKDYKVNP